MSARQQAATVPCPRCDRNPVKSDNEICLECRADEMTDRPAPGARGEPQQQELAPKPAAAPAPAAKPAAAPPPGASQKIDKPATPAPRPAAAPAQFRIGVSKGRKNAPMKVVIYGPHGVGKTTFGAQAPNPVIIPAEVGSEGFDVARLDEPHAPRSFEDIMEAVRFLQEGQHDFKTAVLDTADAIEQFAYQLAIRKFNKGGGGRGGQTADNIEEVGGGYKKGYVAAAQEWIRLLAELERLRERRGMHIVLTAHAKVAKFANPKGEDYDRYTLKLHQEAGLGLVQEWAEAVLFATFKTSATKAHKRAKAKGEGGRERVLYTQFDAAFDAKNRYDLPPMLPLDWAAFAWAVEVNRSPEQLKEAIDRALERLAGVEVEVKGQRYAIADVVAGELAQNPDSRRLAQLKNRLEARVEQLEEERAEQEAAGADAGGAA